MLDAGCWMLLRGILTFVNRIHLSWRILIENRRSLCQALAAGRRHAILSVSATAHMPDVLEMSYRPDGLRGAGRYYGIDPLVSGH